MSPFTKGSQHTPATRAKIRLDHIKSWKDYPKLRFEISNCRTLCEDCHYQHTFGKPKPKTVTTWGRNFTQYSNAA